MATEQFKSSESFGMGLFYTLNVFTMQFYLGEEQALEGWKALHALVR